jgi:hypothetical protein
MAFHSSCGPISSAAVLVQVERWVVESQRQSQRQHAKRSTSPCGGQDDVDTPHESSRLQNASAGSKQDIIATWSCSGSLDAPSSQLLPAPSPDRAQSPEPVSARRSLAAARARRGCIAADSLAICALTGSWALGRKTTKSLPTTNTPARRKSINSHAPGPSQSAARQRHLSRTTAVP